MVEFVNLTPHSIALFHSGKVVQTIPPSGRILRLPERVVAEEKIGDFPVLVKELEIPEDFPEERPGVVYIVSLPVLMALKGAGIHRKDFVAPDTGSGAVRDEKGRIRGTKGFVRLK